jgi:RNA polymerase sigma-70 factor (ECF subfamily)
MMSTEVTRISLLEDTQEYLRQLLAEQVPESVLCRAWDEFYRLYDEMLWRFVAASGLRGPDLDDCLQEVWSTVATRLIHFEREPGRPGLRAWLYTIVRSRAIDLMRQRRRRELPCPQRELERAADRRLSDSSREPDENQCWKEAMIETAIAGLRGRVPEISLRLLELRLLEGRSTAEAAAELGLAPEQVRYRQHRAMEKLKRLVAALTGAPQPHIR